MARSEPHEGFDLNCPLRITHTTAQRYISTRGQDDRLLFENSLFDTFTPDGGLFIPEKIPVLTPAEWQEWSRLCFQDIAFELLSIFISPAEIPPEDLRGIVRRSFGAEDTVVPPLVRLSDGLYLLELFHGPKGLPEDMELRLLGNLFEYFLARKNAGKEGKDRHHIAILHPADEPAIALALGDRRDVSIIRLQPDDVDEDDAQQMSLAASRKNIHTLVVKGSEDDCESGQGIIDMLFAITSRSLEPHLNLATASSISWARTLSQMVIWIHAFFALKRVLPSFDMEADKVRLVLPTRSFDIIACFLVRRMGLPVDKIVIATGEIDPLVSFWATCRYRRQVRQGDLPALPDDASTQKGGQSRQQPPNSRRGDVLVTSSFERLLWYLAREFVSIAHMGDAWNIKEAGVEVTKWLRDLVDRDAFGPVYQDITRIGRNNFVAERVALQKSNSSQRGANAAPGKVDTESLPADFRWDACEATAAGVVASQRSLSRTGINVPHISLAPVAYRKTRNGGWIGDRRMSVPANWGSSKGKEPVRSIANDWQVVRAAIAEIVERDSMRGTE
ncbi:hypothetical protein RB601_003841 [Gaeumannomyces tritici]